MLLDRGLTELSCLSDSFIPTSPACERAITVTIEALSHRSFERRWTFMRAHQNAGSCVHALSVFSLADV